MYRFFSWFDSSSTTGFERKSVDMTVLHAVDCLYKMPIHQRRETHQF